ncbi:MAG: STAS domain-containing protein [Lachnospiraceae bacterium]|nr:STAS domain-containing protein [Lachnospiraceae bacterium]
MKIIKLVHGEQLYLFLEGRLDASAASELEEVLDRDLEGITELIIDLEKLEYLSLAGAGVFFSAIEIMNRKGSMKVVHVNDTIKEIFGATLQIMQTHINLLNQIF